MFLGNLRVWWILLFFFGIFECFDDLGIWGMGIFIDFVV